MTGKRKSAVWRAGRSEADLAKRSPDLEKSGKEQMGHMEGDEAQKNASRET